MIKKIKISAFLLAAVVLLSSCKEQTDEAKAETMDSTTAATASEATTAETVAETTTAVPQTTVTTTEITTAATTTTTANEAKGEAGDEYDCPVYTENGKILLTLTDGGELEEWSGYQAKYRLTNVSDGTVTKIREKLVFFDEFAEISEMKIEYPFGDNCMDMIPWENGVPDFENMDQYFDAMAQWEYTAENKLEPDEYCIISVYSVEPEKTSAVTAVPETEVTTTEIATDVTTAKEKPATTTEMQTEATENDEHFPEIGDTDLPEIFSYAEFDGDNVVICWLSTPEKGNFTIYKSVDNKKYKKIATVKDTESYEYGKADFEKAYFKVKQEYDGHKIESGVIVIEKEDGEWGFTYCDSDEDGIADYLEDFLGTDTDKKDTDGDGISDFDEIAYVYTDPAKYSTYDNGIPDGELDMDGDGVSNKDELENGTGTTTPDSDGDELSDGDERKYKTDPLNRDTDEDGLYDGDEVQLGLDPLTAQTDGTNDGERIFTHKFDFDNPVFDEFNTDDNPMKMAIEFEAAGSGKNNFTVRESGYSNVIRSSAVVGEIPEFSYPENLKLGEVTVKFKADEIIVKGPEDADDELKDIKRFNIFLYFEEMNMLLPVETFFDEENNIIYTKTDCMGTYCVIDLIVWMENMGMY